MRIEKHSHLHHTERKVKQQNCLAYALHVWMWLHSKQLHTCACILHTELSKPLLAINGVHNQTHS